MTSIRVAGGGKSDLGELVTKADHMTDGVSRLKELLFNQEAATLSELRQAIDRLALSEREARELLAAHLSRLDVGLQDGLRVGRDELRQSSEDLRRETLDLAARVEPVVRRAGTSEALKTSVAEVLDDVIVEAREQKQEQLTRAVAPLVVRTIKTELRNSQDEMVEALYPITGRLVQAYVASAMKDMMNQMNRRLEMNPAMLRVRSIVSGYSMAELALAETQRLEVDELFLIRRGSGALLQRWPESAIRSNSDIHMSGVMTAINDFASNAFQEQGGNLRSFNLDEYTVFLRASPVYLLAAKCRGAAVRGVEGLIDAELVNVVALQHEVEAVEAAVIEARRNSLGNPSSEAKGGSGDDARIESVSGVPSYLLADLKTRLEAGIGEKHERLARAGLPFNPLKALVAIVTLALVAGGGWLAWTSHEAHLVRSATLAAIETVPAMRGFPLEVTAGYRGRRVDISGFSPSPAAKYELLAHVRAAIDPAAVIDVDRLAVLPGAGPDLRPQIATVQRDLSGLDAELSNRAIRRSLERGLRRLEQIRPEQDRLLALPDPAQRAVAERSATVIDAAVRDLASYRQARGAEGRASSLEDGPSGGNDRALRDPALRDKLADLADQLQTASLALSSLLADASLTSAQIGGKASPRPSNSNSLKSGAGIAPADVREAAEEVSLAAERIATIVTAAAQASAIRIPPFVPVVTARDRLQAFVRSNAIFFADGDGYRSPDRASAVLDELARLMAQTTALLRVVGYTDERGGTGRNAPLSQSRADKVAQALAARGIARERLAVVGRANGLDLSVSTGSQSTNRRVEFEIGFEDEAP